jgi:hypothetical protein
MALFRMLINSLMSFYGKTQVLIKTTNRKTMRETIFQVKSFFLDFEFNSCQSLSI